MTQITKLLAKIVGTKNPKSELNYTYLDNNKLIATDTRRLMIIDLNYDTNLSLFLNVNNKAIGYTMNTIWNTIPAINSDVGKYPAYNRIIVKDAKIVKSIRSDDVNMIICDIARLGMYFDIKFIQDLFSINGIRLDNLTIEYNEPNMPFQLRGHIINNGNVYSFTYIVMPIVG